MHGSSAASVPQGDFVAQNKLRFRQLAKDSSPKLIGGISVVWLVFVLVMHLLGRAGAWVMIMLTQSATACVDIFALVTLQEYSDGVIREPADVQKTVNPLFTLAIVFRAFSVVQTLHVGSIFLPVIIYIPSLAYELGLLRRFPTTVDAATLWRDVDPMKKEHRVKVAIGVALFFLVMFVMLYSLIYPTRP